jgi:hypothetical protein
MTKHTPALKPAVSAALGYLPRIGYRGWVCTCGARAQRDLRIPNTFVCERPSCESQHAEWIDEVQS